VHQNFSDPPDDPGGSLAWSPPVDIYETEEHYVLKAELPGVKREDIDIEVSGCEISLKGERRAEPTGAPPESYHRLEGVRGRFHRVFSLPESLDKKEILATLRNGVLEVKLPKTATHKGKRG
jgi:HSP20 family protein